MEGADVSWLQDRLTAAGLRTPESGTFDPATDQSVRDFQKIHHLKVDGVVGPATRSALEDVPVISQSKSEAAIQPMPSVPQSAVLSAQGSGGGSSSPSARPIGGDAAADIKRHISSEVHSAVQQIQSSMRETPGVPVGVRPSLIHRALKGTQKSRRLLLKHLVRGHPGWAAALSALLMILTEARDALAWFAAGPFSQAIKPIIPIVPSNLPSLPKSSADVPRFVEQGHSYLQTLAASVPNEWLFRARIAALVLIRYALFRLLARRVDVNALEHELEEAQVLVSDAQAAAK
jgi:peptidoglycan hydrolase-like protein with peptidoglycan-binding domain